MTELVRGLVSDRPWGLTIGQLGLREVTGQLTLHATDGRDYRVAFQQGAIVGAMSPQPADAVTRIAMTIGLISSTQVATIAKQIASTPEIDDIALLSSAARLTPDQIAKLRRRVISQRAARTFSVESGTFVLDDEIAIPIAPDAAVDVRAVILQGARINLSEIRLITELRELGSHFKLGETALEHADWFGMNAEDRPILDALQGGSSLPEIEARHRDLDPRSVQSVIYALVACRECEVMQAAPVRAKTASNEPVSVSFKRTTGEHAIPTRVSTGSSSGDVSLPRTNTTKGSTTPQLIPPAPTPTAEEEFRAAAGTPTKQPSRKAYADDSVPIRARTATPIADESRTKNTAPWPQIQKTPTIPPRDRPPTPAPPPVTPRTISQSGSVTMPRTASQRTPTAPGSTRGTGPHPAVSPARTSSQNKLPRTSSQNDVALARTQSGNYSDGSDRVSQSIGEAAEAFRRGTEALQANDLPAAVEQLSRASTLNPHEFEHSAILAFAQLLAAAPAERTKLADKTRKMVSHYSQRSRDPVQAQVYLGQLERALGNDKQAAVHFRSALTSKPDHIQAAIELQQLEDKALERSGFGLFKKKPT